MKNLFIVCLFVLSACGLPTHKPVVGIYDVTTNDVTNDTCSGKAQGMASPMTVDLKKVGDVYNLYICGGVGADCSQEMLYATSDDGFYFTIGYMFTGSFDISYTTKNHQTTISGTGTTSWMGCTWYTVFDGTKR